MKKLSCVVTLVFAMGAAFAEQTATTPTPEITQPKPPPVDEQIKELKREVAQLQTVVADLKAKTQRISVDYNQGKGITTIIAAGGNRFEFQWDGNFVAYQGNPGKCLFSVSHPNCADQRK